MCERILILINSMNVGGAETFIMKVFRAIDREKIMFDFLLCNQTPGAYGDEIISLDGKIYYGEYKSKKPIKSFFATYRTVKQYGYKKILICSQHPLACLDLLAAKLGGASERAVRSTNSRCGGVVSNILAFIFRPFLNQIATTKLAPSSEAGEWLFGKKSMKKGEVILINNGIDLAIFQYNASRRENFRKQYGLDKKTVIGHIGRFNFQKNHMFLIDVFNAYVQQNPETVLILIGTGELLGEMKGKVEALALTDKVIFYDVRFDIPDCLNAMDVIVFPSLFEGMPNVIVEAQATGLPCLLSDTITKEVQLTDLVYFKSLSDDKEAWADTVADLVSLNVNREEYSGIMRDAGYSIECTAEVITKIFANDGDK